MIKTRNPFVPFASDRTPNYFAGRVKERTFISDLVSRDGEAYRKNLIITGFRGIGKSSLLNYLETEAIKAKWKAIKVDVNNENSETERSLLLLLVERLRALLRECNYTEEDIQRELRGAQAGASDLESAVTAIVKRAVAMVSEKNFKGVIFAFDEAQMLKDSKAGSQFVRTTLLNVLSNVQRSDVSMFYVMVGIPTLLTLLQESKPNIERVFINCFDLDLFNKAESLELISETLKLSSDKITFSKDLIDYIIEKSKGYPYFLQFFCSELIDSATLKSEFNLEDFQAIEDSVIAKLDNVFYGSRVKNLPKADKEYLNATAKLAQPFKPKDLLEEYNRLHPNDKKLGVTIRQAILRLVNKGLLFRAPDGYVYTIPMINEFINRTNGNYSEEDSITKNEMIDLDQLL